MRSGTDQTRPRGTVSDCAASIFLPQGSLIPRSVLWPMPIDVRCFGGVFGLSHAAIGAPTCVAIAQMKPTSSLATAVIATWLRLPRKTRRR